MLHEPLPAAATECPNDTIERYAAQLARDGWCIVPDAMPAGAVGALDRDLRQAFADTPFCEGGFYGRRTKRFGRLLARSPLAGGFVQHRTILGVVERVLSPWCDCLQLNLTQAIALHPGAPPQLPHRDQKRGSQASAPLLRREHQTKLGGVIIKPANLY